MSFLKSLFFTIKPLFLSLFHGNRFSSSMKQYRWGRFFSIVVSKDSHIEIGSCNNFRRNLNLRAVHGGSIKIGNHCFINNNVSITSLDRVVVGDHVKIANNVVIVDHDHDYKNGNQGYISAPVTIEDNVWIGANVVILKGVTIEKSAVVAAGSVVRNNVPANSIAGGVPARVLKTYE